MDQWINDRMILVNAENTQNLRNQVLILCVSMILCRIFWEHEILATRGFAKTHNQFDLLWWSFWIESHVWRTKMWWVPGYTSFCCMFFSLGVFHVRNPKKHIQQSRAHWSFFGCSFQTVFKSKNSYWRFSPKINLVQILTRESSISPGCHGPIFCTWPTLPMRPEPICLARERHGLFWKGCASMLGLIVPEGDGIPSEICFKSGDVVDIILIWGVQWYQITRKKQPDNCHVQRWHIYNSWGLLIVCLDPKWMPGVRHILTCVHAVGIGRL